MSFFDDDEETTVRPAARTPRRGQATAGGGAGTAGARAGGPRPRRPQQGGGGADHQTVLIRRGIAVAALIVLVIVIALVISSIVKSDEQGELKTYTHEVSALARESDARVSQPLFTLLTGAAGKPALDVEEEVASLRGEAESLYSRAKGLSAPGEMTSAQRDLLRVFDLRVEGMSKLAEHLPGAYGGQAKQAGERIAGDMEIFLASDVLYSQRAAPLITEALAKAGIHGLTPSGTRSLPNIGWLDSATVLSRLGQTSASSSSPLAPGTHGSAFLGVSVGATTLEAEPTVNHLSTGPNPTFTVNFEDSGENPESNVKVEVTVTAAGKQYKGSHVVTSTQPGEKYAAEVTVSGVPTGVPAKVEAYVAPVPGETNTENNKQTYLAVFGG